MRFNLRIEPWMRDELERRKNLCRDLFAGRGLSARGPVDFFPGIEEGFCRLLF
jgi:hypothetical protein